MLPEFTPDGRLPPGDHKLSLGELRESILVAGPGRGRPGWNSVWRGRLVDNLGILVRQLWQIGVTEIFAGGSFAEDVECPRDIDVYFDYHDRDDVQSGMLAYKLNLLAPQPFWSWAPRDRKPDERGKNQTRMWHKYRIDIYPHYGQVSGVKGRGDVLFPDLLRYTNTLELRGVVKIEKTGPLDRESFSSVLLVAPQAVLPADGSAM